MKKLISAMLFVFVCAAGAAFAHSGGLDAKGGHHVRSTGEYHYHRHTDENDESGTPHFAPVKIEDFERMDILKVSADGKEQMVKLIGVVPVHDDKEVLKGIKDRFVGKTAYIELDKTKTDKSNRLLAYVWLTKPENTNTRNVIKGDMYNAMLIVSGLAKAHTTSQNSMYNDDFTYFAEHQATAQEPAKREPPKRESAKENIEKSTSLSVKIEDFISPDELKVSSGKEHFVVKLIGVGSVDKHADVLKSIKERFAGKTVTLELDKEKQDKSGRLLAYVWLSKPSNSKNEKEVKEKMYNAMLIVSGLAKAHTTSKNEAYNDVLKKLGEEAKKK